MSPLGPLALALAAIAIWLALRLARASRARSAARAAYLDAVRDLFDSTETRVEPSGFPRMTGRRAGLAFDLQAIPDTLTFRKLPALWVMVTLPAPQPVTATLDLMARPSGNEIFSRFAMLPQSLSPSPALPAHVAVRTDNATGCPPLDRIAKVTGLFDDPQVKELVISPQGLRIVILAEEADRGRFLLFREAEMGMIPLPASRLNPILDRLTDLSRLLAE